MAKSQIWWKKLWESMWGGCGMIANKLTKLWVFIRSFGFMLWKFEWSGGTISKIVDSRCNGGGKNLLISELIKSVVSTVST